MTNFLRAAAVVGLGIMLLAAGEAPNVQTAAQRAVQTVSRQATYGLSAADLFQPATNEQLVAGLVATPLPSERTYRQQLPATDTADMSTGALAADLSAETVAQADTLSDAVELARRSNAIAMDADMKCLATAVYFESKSEPLQGQLAVAQVILNRVASGRYGNNVCDVVKAPKQFSFVRDGNFDTPRNQKQYSTAKAIAWIASNRAWDSIVGKATHFHATRVSPNWQLERIAAIGNHIFYR